MKEKMFLHHISTSSGNMLNNAKLVRFCLLKLCALASNFSILYLIGEF